MQSLSNPDNSLSYTIICKKCNNITNPIEAILGQPYSKGVCKTERCQAINYITYCPACGIELKTHNQSEFSSGKIIKCTCKKSFETVNCPACNHVNYFNEPFKYVMGGKVACAKCSHIFQQVTCPHCSVSSYWQGKPNNFYNAGVVTPCWNCKNSFQHLNCPHCKSIQFFPKNDYIIGMKQKCIDCSKEFQHVNCPKCVFANYFKDCNFQFGKPNRCLNQVCNANFEVIMCPKCFKENLWEINQNLNSDKFQHEKECWSCQNKFFHTSCKECNELFYPEVCQGANIFTCLKCKSHKIYLYSCLKCKKVSKCLSAQASHMSVPKFECNYCPPSITNILNSNNNSLFSQIRNQSIPPRYQPLFGDLDRNLLGQRFLGLRAEGSLFSNYSSNNLTINNSNQKEESKVASSNSQNSTPEDSTCAICLTNSPNYSFVPCGHLCICEECKNRSSSKLRECPFCRQKYTQIMRVYKC